MGKYEKYYFVTCLICFREFAHNMLSVKVLSTLLANSADDKLIIKHV